MDKQELYQKAEKALNQAFETAKKSIKVVSEKAGEAANITKLLVEKVTLEHRVSRRFAGFVRCSIAQPCCIATNSRQAVVRHSVLYANQ